MPLSRLLLALFLDILPRDLFFFASRGFVLAPSDQNCSSSDGAIATGGGCFICRAGRRVIGSLTFVQNVAVPCGWQRTLKAYARQYLQHQQSPAAAAIGDA